MDITKTVRIFAERDLVFAKLGKFIPWPGQVSQRDGDRYYVEFYGTGNGAWLNAKCIVPYVDDYKKLYVTAKNLKQKNFKTAVDQIEEEILVSGFDISHVDDFELEEAAETIKDVLSKSKSEGTKKKKKSINPWDRNRSRSKVKTERVSKSEEKAQRAVLENLTEEKTEALKQQFYMVKAMKDICIALSLARPTMKTKTALSKLRMLLDIWPNVTKMMLVKYRSVVDNLQRLTHFIPESSSGEKIYEQDSYLIRSYAELNLLEIYKIVDAPNKSEFALIFEEQRAEFEEKVGNIDDENQLFVLLSYDELKV